MGFHLGSWRAVGVSPGLLAGRLGFHLGSWWGGWGFTWAPGGAVGVSPGLLARRLGFHLGSWRGSLKAVGVSPGLLVGRLGFHLGSWPGGLGFHLGFCRAAWGFLEFAVTLEPPSRDPEILNPEAEALNPKPKSKLEG